MAAPHPQARTHDPTCVAWTPRPPSLALGPWAGSPYSSRSNSSLPWGRLLVTSTPAPALRTFPGAPLALVSPPERPGASLPACSFIWAMLLILGCH